MTRTGIFIDYHGNIDYPATDLLLTGLKNNQEFRELFITTRKRIYSLIVESVENLCKYSALIPAEDRDLQPSVIVRNEEKRITIITGNVVPENKKDELVHKLEYVNSLGNEDLKKLHEVRINKKAVDSENGAGLGFIYMAFKSRNRLIYRFKPLIPGYLFFELEIYLNK